MILRSIVIFEAFDNEMNYNVKHRRRILLNIHSL